jgi:virginiamycin B lyase
VAVDAGHVYWANVVAGTIGRANLDGTGANQSFIGGASRPRGVAVDARHVYWTDEATGTIGRANLDGTDANHSFIGGASAPFGVAVGPGSTEALGPPPIDCV